MPDGAAASREIASGPSKARRNDQSSSAISGSLGDTGFETAGQKHIELHPPHGWTLADYGNGFDHTLSDLYPPSQAQTRSNVSRRQSTDHASSDS